MADREDALTCAIGDVHGHIGKLERLLERCEGFAPGRAKRFVFIGDYIDRGPDSRAVVDLLINLQRDLGEPGRMPAGQPRSGDPRCGPRPAGYAAGSA